MTSEILSNFSKIRRRGDRNSELGIAYKPHKPLLILLALRKLQVNGSSKLLWTNAKTQLGELLREFNNNSTVGPHDPFYRLTKDDGDLWHLTGTFTESRYPAELNEQNPIGSFSSDIEKELLKNNYLLLQLVRQTLEMQFDAPQYSVVLEKIGFDYNEVFSVNATSAVLEIERKRDQNWVKEIRKIWNNTCAFCGYDGKINDYQIGTEAAHIRAFKQDGPDDLDNGFVLCSLHHKLFDNGALSVRANLTLAISRNFTIGEKFKGHFEELRDKEILLPDSGIELNDKHLNWHFTNRFRQ
jgi:putative restriction endonuclease